MKFAAAAFAATLILSLNSFASDHVATIDQVLQNKKRATATLVSGAKVEAGSSVVVEFADQKNCESKVIKKQDGKLLLDLADCARFENVVKGQKVIASTFQDDDAAPAAAAAAAKPATNPEDNYTPPHVPRKIRFGGGVYANGGKNFRFLDYKQTTIGVTSEGEAELETESAVGLFVEIGTFDKNRANFNVGFAHETDRDAKSEEIKFDSGVSSTTSISGTKIKMNYVYGNYLYRWETFFLYGGLNISLPGVEGSSLKLKPAMGLQGGLGFAITENILADLSLKMLGFTTDKCTDSGTGDVVEYGTGYLFGGAAGLKFLF